MLTCAVDSISLKSSVAGTLKAANSISAGGIDVTVVQFQVTLIYVC